MCGLGPGTPGRGQVPRMVRAPLELFQQGLGPLFALGRPTCGPSALGPRRVFVAGTGSELVVQVERLVTGPEDDVRAVAWSHPTTFPIEKRA